MMSVFTEESLGKKKKGKQHSAKVLLQLTFYISIWLLLKIMTFSSNGGEWPVLSSVFISYSCLKGFFSSVLEIQKS